MNKNTIFIAGASSEIGSAYIEKYVDEYDLIIAHGNTSLDELKNKFKRHSKIVYIKADFNDVESLNNMITEIVEKDYRPNQLLFLSSPKAFNLPFRKCGWEKFEQEINVSFRALIIILKAVLPYMTKIEYGRIVTILSSYTVNLPVAYQAPYVSAKYALLGLIKALAVEYAQKGITFNGISPQMIETKFLSDIPELIIKKNAESRPLKRNLSVMDVIPTIHFLLQEESSMITGENIPILGGS